MRQLAIACWLLGACGGATLGELDGPELPAVSTPADVPVGLVPGETMQFEVAVAGIRAGEAQFAVGEPGEVDGQPAIVVSSRLTSAGVGSWLGELRDEATTVVALGPQLPLRTTATFAFGRRSYRAETTYRDRTAQVTFHPEGGGTRDLRYAFDDDIHDTHTAMARVRAWSARPGERLDLWLIAGRRIWRTEVSAVGAEIVGTAHGNRAAIRLNGTSRRARADRTIDASKPARSFSVWLSDDGDRVPLRVTGATELGELTIELVDYQRP